MAGHPVLLEVTADIVYNSRAMLFTIFIIKYGGRNELRDQRYQFGGEW